MLIRTRDVIHIRYVMIIIVKLVGKKHYAGIRFKGGAAMGARLRGNTKNMPKQARAIMKNRLPRSMGFDHYSILFKPNKDRLYGRHMVPKLKRIQLHFRHGRFQ